MMNKLIYCLLCVAIVGSFSGCANNNNSSETDTPTSGEISIIAEESFSPIIKTQVETFESLYQQTKINVTYRPEDEAFQELLAGNARMIIMPRKLTKEEKASFEKETIVPTEIKIAYDALAVIINPANKDSMMTLETFGEIVSGKASAWKNVNKASSLGKISVIYDSSSSSALRFIKEKFKIDSLRNSYALKNSEEIINYVSKNKNAIGIIGVNWISDVNDTTSTKFMEKIRVVSLKSDNPKADPSEYYAPYQAYIALKYYPLYREIYIVSREARTGLASGLSSFLSKERGQRIFLKSGLVPAKMPIRLVELKETEDL
ncbi:MAG TPA: substrate-binding domain-containing protein [Ignavibacteriales bacterium]|nr:substrate-binding domain-containing protein [Ignavibacteriales bacterium]